MSLAHARKHRMIRFTEPRFLIVVVIRSSGGTRRLTTGRLLGRQDAAIVAAYENPEPISTSWGLPPERSAACNDVLQPKADGASLAGPHGEC